MFEVFGLKIIVHGSENTGCSEDSESQGSLQGVVRRADLDSLLENGHLTASGVFKNSLSEELKVLNLTFGFGHKLLVLYLYLL